MVRRTGLVAAFALALAVQVIAAQEAISVPRRLSLSEALDLAKRNSPSYRQALNDADPAGMTVRAARAALLPTIGAGGSLGYSGAGRSTFGGTTFNQTSPSVSSGYSISASWQVSAGNFLAPAQASALERATDEGIASAGVGLISSITSQYLSSLRAAASVEVARQQVARNQEFLDLARARAQVGQTTALDVRQAEVNKGRADVSLLQALQGLADAKIELLRLIGLPSVSELDSLQLTEQFPLVEPRFDLATLKTTARESNPGLRSLRESQRSAQLGVRSARLSRLPSFSVSTGLSGFTQQFTNENALINNALHGAQANAENCDFLNGILSRLTSPHPSPNGGITPDCNAASGLNPTGDGLLPEVSQPIRDNNSVFPFHFARQPWSIRFGVELPIWDAYSTSLRVSQARAQEDDVREAVRAQELQTNAQLQSQLLAARTAWASAQIQDANRTAARQQLTLAQDRYRVGSGTALEVSDAQNAVTQAEADYVTAVYNYHLAVVGLEAAVGRPLR